MGFPAHGVKLLNFHYGQFQSRVWVDGFPRYSLVAHSSQYGPFQSRVWVDGFPRFVGQCISFDIPYGFNPASGLMGFPAYDAEIQDAA